MEYLADKAQVRIGHVIPTRGISHSCAVSHDAKNTIASRILKETVAVRKFRAPAMPAA